MGSNNHRAVCSGRGSLATKRTKARGQHQVLTVSTEAREKQTPPDVHVIYELDYHFYLVFHGRLNTALHQFEIDHGKTEVLCWKDS
jgi:hypothetical protein